ncbi:ABC transporter substrate-binding protein [Devosia sp. 1566]|uniref:ABC transporter substrate-binding protein n=1 Tax=Devosia sp. 1566 TaxID=2499144 RepID=UPI000FD711CD|nr:ABC transporter substrate-binding protein [Devosia sp. 1566]
MKPHGLLRTALLALSLSLGAVASSPVMAQSRPVIFLERAEPVSLDPMFTQADANVILSIHETLFRLDNAGEVVPAIAESITMIDPLDWEIKIRPNLVFHNGEPINADAAVFTFDRAKRLFEAGEGDLTFALGALKYDHMEKVDDLTVKLVMTAPDPIITSHMVNPELSLLPPKYYSEHTPEQVAFAPVGAGGYQFVSYRPGEGLVLKAFEKYRLGKPPVDDVVIRAVPEVATRISEMKAGSADLMVGVPADLKADLESSGVNVVVAASYRRLFVAIKQGRHPALADVKVRQAMNYAINCEEMADALLGGMAECSIDLVNPPHQDPNLKPYAYDPEKAEQLLDEAGWVVGSEGVREKDGVRLSLNFDTTNGSYLMDSDMAQVMAEYWKEVGIEIADLRVIDASVSSQMRAQQGAGYRDLMNSSSGPDYTCQGDLLLVQKDSGSNRMSWVDDKFEAMFVAFNQEFDQSKWTEMCNAAQAYVAEKAPVVWLFTEPTLYGTSPRLQYEPRRDGRVYLNLVLKGVTE